MWKRFYLKPFEAFVGLFVIVNGILTISPGGTGSTVKDSLWNLLGYTGIAIPITQIMAGLAKILGIALNRSNLEAAGLIMVSTIFAIRAYMLIADGDVSAADINSEVIAIGIIASNIIRLTQVLNCHRYIVIEGELVEMKPQ